MKQIFNEIATIDQNLFSLQDMLAKIDLYKRQCDQDVASKKQKADLVYVQTIEQIQNQKRQVEATYTQTLTSCKQKRKDAESRSQTQYGNRERQIRSNCDAIIQDLYSIHSHSLLLITIWLWLYCLPGYKTSFCVLRYEWYHHGSKGYECHES